ncbi:LOW QUALITY PROTEIN: E3 ubiquitin/ISG15 ligase TRIM25-like [Bufo bufo]|uniref:LOW QUALITY PROTEIN: E3 ubiquitin/ISG15 ligase TRIM25-like n=1 Tax=Bufo bufo TaxID=8384 RepID=UPI001ABE2349|nr:LOW QUALITY PROTEIN: E3 ubiquitin/ISG15 ligase TRIM25-like [Bufo bufo]
MAFAALKEELTCSICLNIYADPVLLRCGHNFCRFCIDRALDSQEAFGLYSCPDCRREFPERPALQSNLKLRNIAEYFNSTQPAQTETEVFCSNCLDAPVPAVIYCLHCEVSLCDNHLRVHSKSQEHVLMEPCSSLRVQKCLSHHKALTYYCCDENICICVSCLLNEKHREHQVIGINEAFRKKMDKLRSVMAKEALMTEDVEEKIQNLQTHKKNTSAKTARLTQHVNVTFKKIKRQLDDLAKRVLCEIARREEQTSLSISDLIQQLDLKKDELSRKMRHMEKLCNMTDPLSFLQDQKADVNYFFDPELKELCERVVKMTNAVNDSEESDLRMVQVGLSGIMGDVGITKDLLTKEATEMLLDVNTSANYDVGIKKYLTSKEATEILLDINTAANNVCLSGDLKTVSCAEVHQNRPETTQRFEECKVLSTRSFTSGQHYWDLDTCKSGHWRVGVAYASMERRGPFSLIGKNEKSLGLRRSSDSYFLRFNDREIRIYNKPVCDKIRVYLDYDAGQLSFYQLSDPIAHIHTVTTTFTQPLHAAFAVYDDGWITLRN